METTLIHGDCLEVIKTIPDGSVDLVVTSPPYDDLRQYSQFSFQQFQSLSLELLRCLKNGGVIVWVVQDATVKGSETGTSFKQALQFKEVGLNLHDTMIWEKASRIPTQDRYYNVIEYMFVLSKGKPKTMNFITDHKNRSEGQLRKKDKVINKGNNIKADGFFTTGAYSRRSNIWRYGTAGNGSGHPAIFPEQLASDHIKSWSNEGYIVLDPFMGSGTTGRAAVNLNRHFIGIELDVKYFQIAEERINAARYQLNQYAIY